MAFFERNKHGHVLVKYYDKNSGGANVCFGPFINTWMRRKGTSGTRASGSSPRLTSRPTDA